MKQEQLMIVDRQNAIITQDVTGTLMVGRSDPHYIPVGVITISCKQQSLVTTDNLANTLGANDYKEPQSVVYDI